MRRYLELSFFSYITPNSKANLSPQKLHTAYEEFVEVIFGESQTECNITCYYNRLIYTRVELESIQANLHIGSEKKCTNWILPVKSCSDYRCPIETTKVEKAMYQ